MTEYSGQGILYNTVTGDWTYETVLAYDDDVYYLPGTETDIPASSFLALPGGLVPLGSVGMGTVTMTLTTVTGGSGFFSSWGVPFGADQIFVFPNSGGAYGGRPPSSIADFQLLIPINSSSGFLQYTSLGMSAVSEDDVFVAGAGDDRILGGVGDDDVSGLAGRDRLFGQSGDDTLDGGGGNDRLSGGRNDDVLIGRGGRDLLEGGQGTDRLYGNRGDDTLYGQTGQDRLIGSDGDDVLWGGPGRDRFVYRDADEGSDTIGDFVRGTDSIDLRGVVTGMGGLTITYEPLGARVSFGTTEVFVTSATFLDGSDFLF